MSRTYLPVLALLLCSVAASAQVKQRTLKGYMGLEGGESFTYEMDFKDSAGRIKGYAYTWLQKGKEVKASIKGEIDKKARTVSFYEDEIIYNKGFASNVTICLVKATLRYQKDAEGGYKLSGVITSNDAGNAYCGSGSISFLDDAQLTALFTEEPQPAPAAAQKPIEKPRAQKPMRIVYDTASAPVYQQPAAATKEPEKITSGKEKYIDWYSDTVIVEVWDSQIDGDEVSVQFDGQTVLPMYKLTKEKRTLRLPMNKDKMEIGFTAGNEGSFPPSTVEVMLIDGTRKHPIVAYNTIGKQSVVKLRKVR